MANVIIAGILIVIIGFAVAYLVRAKKKGVRCVGCPSGGSCPHHSPAKTETHSECSCGCHKEE